MARYKIVNAQADQSSGGPDIGVINSEVELLTDDGKTIFLSIAEADGMPTIMKTDESIFEKLMDIDEYMDEVQDYIENKQIYGDDSYDALFEDHDEIGDLYEAVRYLVYITQIGWDDMEKYIGETKGKFIDEIDIPKSPAEEEWENPEDDD